MQYIEPEGYKWIWGTVQLFFDLFAEPKLFIKMIIQTVTYPKPVV